MLISNPVAQLQKTQLHRDTYIAVLNSVLNTWGAKREFAGTLGITPRYLSNLLDPTGYQTPSSELAQRIAEAVPLPDKSKQDLLHHLRCADPHGTNSQPVTNTNAEYLTAEQVRDVILTIGNYEHRALYNTDTLAVRNAYSMLLKLGTWTLGKLDPSVHPQHYVGICLSLHGTASTLNMPVKSMWFANAGLAVARNTAFWHSEELHVDHAGVLINAWDGLATAWHNLKRPGKALVCVQQAKRIAFNLPDKTECDRWLPGIAMEELNTYAIHPFFSIKAAESARDLGLNSLYSSISNRASLDLLASLINRNMLESYVQHGTQHSLRKAERYFEQHYDEHALSRYGPLVHALHLRTTARLHQATRNINAYGHAMHKAYSIASQAGLIHQQTEISQEIQQYQPTIAHSN